MTYSMARTYAIKTTNVNVKREDTELSGTRLPTHTHTHHTREEHLLYDEFIQSVCIILGIGIAIEIIS